MNILIVGSGAREHALVKALQRSPQSPSLYCYGSAVNPGIRQWVKNYEAGSLINCDTIAAFAQQHQIELALIGPEAPLEQGLADKLWALDIPVIGPKKALAQLETSKTFTRKLMEKYNIPGLPRFKTFTTLTKEVNEFLEELGEKNYVIKANGLMGGKGVKIAQEHLYSFDEAILFCKEILEKKQSFVIEEKLIGQEFSYMGFADGHTLIPMPLVQDHKRAYVGDKGPNTGGMGSYSCENHGLPFLTAKEIQDAWEINQAVFAALGQEFKERYIGIVYGSFIATQKGIYVIEFNARFGDPEALNVLTLLESDFVAICQAMVQGNLNTTEVKFRREATVCKYAVPEGYPDSPLTNFEIDIKGVNNSEHLYLGAVNQTAQTLLATGSRTAAYVGVANTITAAEKLAEAEIVRIKGPLYHRKDIGTEALLHARLQARIKD